MEGSTLNINKLLKEAKSHILNNSDVMKGFVIIKKILKHDPNNFWAHIYYGVAAQKKGNAIEALKTFERATKLNPENVAGWKGIINCSESLKDHCDKHIIVVAYSNLLRLENNDDKWKELLAKVEKLFPSDLVQLLSSCIDSQEKSSFKLRASSSIISLQALNNTELFYQHSNAISLSFKEYVSNLDIFDKSTFCNDVSYFYFKVGDHKHLFDFVFTTVVNYGVKPFSNFLIAKIFVHISLNDVSMAKELVPFIRHILEANSMGNDFFPVFKTAMGIVYFLEEEYVEAREILEVQSHSGVGVSSLMLLKLLIRLKDYDGVVFLALRLNKTFFQQISNPKYRFEFFICVIEALSCSNEVKFLNLSLKLSAKCLKLFGFQPRLFYNMCYASIGLNNKKCFYYLKKLCQSSCREGEVEFLKSLIKRESVDLIPACDSRVYYYMHAASLSLVSGDLENAVKLYKKVREVDSKVADTFIILGLSYEVSGDHAKATKCYDSALKMKPYDPTALKLFCNLLLKLGLEELSLIVLESNSSGLFSKWHSTAEKACKAAGLIHCVRNENSKALQNFRHGIKLSANSKDFTELIADTYVHMRMLGCAENYYVRLLSQDMTDLHIMLSLTNTMKLNLNFSGYYNNAIKCLNCIPSENSNLTDYKNILSLILCNLAQLYKNKGLNSLSKSKIDDSIKKLYIVEMVDVKGIYSQSLADFKSNKENSLEYLIAIYFFLESHYLAAVKYMKRRDFIEASKLFQFCLSGICNAFAVYGTTLVALWKLLGDVLLSSSSLKSTLQVPPWLSELFNKECPNEKINKLSPFERISFALKSYIVGLKSVTLNQPSRQHEFYYDISVAFVSLANHPKTVCPKLKYHFYKCALESISQSFIEYSGSESDLWIHFSAMGAITSMMGSTNDLFNGPFTNYSMDTCEEIRINNQATYFLKLGLEKDALGLYNSGKLIGDTGYASPWVGQLYISMLLKSHDIKSKLLYQIKFHGNHPLLKWLCALYLLQMEQKPNFDKGERDMFERVFSANPVSSETNISRLTILGYAQEILGEISSARRNYFKALRSASINTSEEVFNILITNSARLSGRCCESLELLSIINNQEITASALSLLNFSHILKNSIDMNIFNNSILLMKYFIENTFSIDSICYLLTPLVLTSIYKFNALSLFEIPTLFEIIVRNIFLIIKYRKSWLKKIITSQSGHRQEIILRHLENCLFSYSLQSFDSSPVLVPEESISYILSNNSYGSCELCVEKTLKNGLKCDLVCTDKLEENLFSVVEPLLSGNKDDLNNSGKNNLVLGKICPYSNKLFKLRRDIFPLPISYQDRFLRKRQKIFDLQSKKQQCSKDSNEISVFSPPFMKAADINISDPLLEIKAKEQYENHGCHTTCRNIVSLFYKNMKQAKFEVAAKYCNICLGIRCLKCFNIKDVLPVISFLSIKLRDLKLLQRTIHLYPSEIVLWKSLILISSK